MVTALSARQLVKFSLYALFSLLISLGLASVIQAQSPLTFSKVFSPDTIGPGSVTTLSFAIGNPNGSPATNVVFSDTLPAGITIATPANASSSCGQDAVLSAPDGGSTISFSDGTLSAGGSCAIQVNVTSAAPGTHSNTSGDLTSNFGNSGPATDDLNVVTTLPGFSKSFSPNSVSLGSRSTLTFIIDNTANASGVDNLDFTDNLPAGMVIADPANASTTCGTAPPVLTAVPGTTVIILDANGNVIFPAIAAGASCSVTVDVVASGGGQLNNISGDLMAQFVSSGKASDVLTATVDPLALQKQFIDDPVAPGDSAVLQFSITNYNRTDSATNITFSDDLDATLSGLEAVGLPLSNVCGAGSQLSGTSAITLTGGALAPEASCVFSISLQVPNSTPTGIYLNTTSNINGNVGGSPTTGSPASDKLFVEPSPIISKHFMSDAVAAGDTITLSFTITNTSQLFSATDINFIDELTTFLPFPISVNLPANGFCGAGSSMSVVFIDTDRQGIQLTGGNLPALGSCTFSVSIDIPIGLSVGNYVNTTETVFATVNGQTYAGNTATDSFFTVQAPRLKKVFTDDPVQPGDLVTLAFTLTYGSSGDSIPGLPDATNISFSDDLDAVVSGLVATNLPLNNVCGPGSQLSGTTVLQFSGGSLAQDETCTFSATLQIPANAPIGSHTNTTSDITATVDTVTPTGPAAEDALDIVSLMLEKSFTDDPVIPGDLVTLAFTITNISPVSTATNITFQDNLDNAVDNMTALGLPLNNVCGAGSQLLGLSGNTFLYFSGGTLLPGEFCTFSVTLQVPGSTVSNIYRNVTSAFSANIDGSTISFDNASDRLTVSSELLLLTKTFVDDPVIPGGTAILEFSLTNTDPSQSVTSLQFTDDLTATLPGLTATGLPLNNVCGAGSSIAGTDFLTFSGGSLAPLETCTFSVTLQVPADVQLATQAINVTSQISGLAGGLPVDGNVATDQLDIEFLSFDKSFNGFTTATGTPELYFTITNLSDSQTANLIGFTDDLGGVISGLVATNLPLNDVCGAGSQITGSSFLQFSNGTLGPDETCNITVTLQVPITATAGSYQNVTSDLDRSGLSASGPAVATLIVEPPPIFSKHFAPNSIGQGLSSSLTFVIDNSISAVDANNLDFTDNLPAGIVVASPANASTTCSGGTVTAVAGSGVIAYSGGSIGIGSSCNIQVDVVGNALGAQLNVTGDLTSSSGNSGTATDTLTVNSAPGFSKSFNPATTIISGTSALNFNIDNTASATDATSIILSDTLPSGLVVATTPNTNTTCSGGTITAPAGGSNFNYLGGSVSAASSCTVSVDVTPASAGTYLNVSGNLISSLGNSGPATATLTVNPPPAFSKAFNPSTIGVAETTILSFSIDNTTSTTNATSLAFTDTLPAGVVVASMPNTTTTCIGGSLSALAGGNVINYQGGSILAGSNCTISVNVTSVVTGNHLNISDNLTSSLGDSGIASDTLTVNIADVSISKWVTPTSAYSGQAVSYVLSFSNTGLAQASGVVITDIVPLSVTNTSVSNSGAVITQTAPGYVWAVQDLAVGGGGIITISGILSANVPTGTLALPPIFSNTAHISANYDSNANNNSASAVITVTEQIFNTDLGISKSVWPASALPGDAITYTLAFSNAGPDTATNVIITDTIPVSVTNLSVSNSGAVITQTAPGYVWTVQDLAVGEGGIITISGILSANLLPQTIINTASITGTDDVSATNNTSSASINVVEVILNTDLGISKSVSPASAFPGSTIVYTLVFSNAGPDTATNVVITDTIPASVTNLSVSNSGAIITQTAPGYVWAVQDLAGGEGGIITISGILSTSAGTAFLGTTITNTATITGANDVNLTNNSSSASVSFLPEPAYAIYLPLILKAPSPRPDLIVTDVSLTQLSENSYNIQLTAQNRSTVAVDVGNNFFINAYLTTDLNNPIYVCGVQGSSFGPGASFTCPAEVYSFTVGTHIVRGWVDPFNTVDESDESNNTLDSAPIVISGTRTLSVPQPAPAGPLPTPTSTAR